jgi:SAM-dependent methyltransferase
MRFWVQGYRLLVSGLRFHISGFLFAVMLRRLHNWFVYPHRLAVLRRRLPRGRAAVVLDVGCGNHSPRITKRCWPGCVYHGLDNRSMNRDAEDERLMDRFFGLDLRQPGALATVPDRAYDVVICSHVLEHLEAPTAIVADLAAKVAPDGVLYLEVPSRRSLRLPRAEKGWFGVRGCLHFADDDTHRTLVDLRDLAPLLRRAGLTPDPVRTRRLWRQILLLPLYVAAVLVVKRFIPASLLWDITGAAEYLIAARKA